MSTNGTIELHTNEPPDLAAGKITFIGNATTVIRFAGFTILTDPTFLHQGDHVHLGHGMYARREVNPPARSLICRRSICACCPITTATTSMRWPPGSWTNACPSSPLGMR
jgi:hypothetical protein